MVEVLNSIWAWLRQALDNRKAQANVRGGKRNSGMPDAQIYVMCAESALRHLSMRSSALVTGTCSTALARLDDAHRNCAKLILAFAGTVQ